MAASLAAVDSTGSGVASMLAAAGSDGEADAASSLAHAAMTNVIASTSRMEMRFK